MRVNPWLIQIVGLMLLVWVLNRIAISETARQVADANWVYVLASASLGVPLFWLKSQRWRLVLETTGSRTSPWLAFRLFTMGQLAALATPGQIGDLFKAFRLRRHGGTLRSGIVGSVGDRALDLAFLVGLGMYYLVLMEDFLPALDSVVVLTLWVVAFSVATSWLWMVSLRVLAGLRVADGLTVQVSKSLAGTIAAYTLAAYVLVAIRFLILLVALDHSAPIAEFVSSMAIMSLAALLPISPAGIGTRDAALVFLFDRMDISTEAAIAFSFLVLVLHMFTAAFGAVAWWLDFADKQEVAK